MSVLVFIRSPPNDGERRIEASYHILKSSELWNHIRNNQLIDGSSVHFQLIDGIGASNILNLDDDNKVIHEVMLSKEQFYDLPEGLDLRCDRPPGVPARD